MCARYRKEKEVRVQAQSSCIQIVLGNLLHNFLTTVFVLSLSLPSFHIHRRSHALCLSHFATSKFIFEPFTILLGLSVQHHLIYHKYAVKNKHFLTFSRIIFSFLTKRAQTTSSSLRVFLRNLNFPSSFSESRV